MTAREVSLRMEKRYALFGLFFAFHNRLQAVGDSFYEEITCKQFFLLACMNLYTEEAPTAMELAGTMGCSRQSVKEILNSLEKKDFVCLQADPKDRRKRRIFLTEKAKAMAEQYREKEAVFMKRLYADVTDVDIECIYEVLSHIENNLKEISETLIGGAHESSSDI